MLVVVGRLMLVVTVVEGTARVWYELAELPDECTVRAYPSEVRGDGGGTGGRNMIGSVFEEEGFGLASDDDGGRPILGVREEPRSARGRNAG